MRYTSVFEIFLWLTKLSGNYDVYAKDFDIVLKLHVKNNLYVNIKGDTLTD